MGLHINPLRKKKVLALNPDLKVTSDENEEHMTYREAAIVALILTVTQFFTTFLTLFDWTRVAANPNAFMFEMVKFVGATFFSIFIVLSGMARFMAE